MDPIHTLSELLLDVDDSFSWVSRIAPRVLDVVNYVRDALHDGGSPLDAAECDELARRLDDLRRPDRSFPAEPHRSAIALLRLCALAIDPTVQRIQELSALLELTSVVVDDPGLDELIESWIATAVTAADDERWLRILCWYRWLNGYRDAAPVTLTIAAANARSDAAIGALHFERISGAGAVVPHPATAVSDLDEALLKSVATAWEVARTRHGQRSSVMWQLTLNGDHVTRAAGPSLGLPLAAGFAACQTDQVLEPHVLTTGEILVDGTVGRVDVAAKLRAAVADAVTTAVVPVANTEQQPGLVVHRVTRLEDAWDHLTGHRDALLSYYRHLTEFPDTIGGREHSGKKLTDLFVAQDLVCPDEVSRRWDDALSQAATPIRVLVTAGSGEGKSTHLHMSARTRALTATDLLHDGIATDDLPLIVSVPLERLRSSDSWPAPTDSQWLRKVFGILLVEAETSLASYIADHAREDRVHFFLDALDRLNADESRARADRLIHELTSNGSRCHVVVTSHASTIRPSDEAGFEVFELSGFSKDQRDQYVQLRLPSREKQQRFNARIADPGHLEGPSGLKGVGTMQLSGDGEGSRAQFVTSPFLLCIAVWLLEEDVLPRDFRLDTFLDQALKRLLALNPDNADTDIRAEEWFEFLPEFAIRLKISDESQFTRGAFKRAVEKAAPLTRAEVAGDGYQSMTTTARTGLLLDELCSCGVIAPDDPSKGTYRWRHVHFLDFFAAKAIEKILITEGLDGEIPAEWGTPA